MNLLLLLIFGGLYFSPLSDQEQFEATAAITAGTLLFNIETASLWLLLRFLRFDPTVKQFSNDAMEETGVTSLMRGLGLPSKGGSGTKRPPPYAPYDYSGVPQSPYMYYYH